MLKVAMTSLALGACTQTGTQPPLQTASTSASTTLQSSGSIAVFDYVAPRNYRMVLPDWAAINAQPLGSKGNPVRTFLPRGQHAYLSRLVCPDGLTPSFYRIKNYGHGVYTTIIDGYHVRCGDMAYTIFLDMYHPTYRERRPVPGFTIRPPNDAA